MSNRTLPAVTMDTMQAMAQKLAAFAQRRSGVPVVEEASEMLLLASSELASLTRALESWEHFGRELKLSMPVPRTP